MGAVPGWFAKVSQRSGTHGSHLTLQASEDYKAPTYGGPVTLSSPR